MENLKKTNANNVRVLLVSPDYLIETSGSYSRLIKNGVEIESFDASLILTVILRIAKEIGGGAE